MRVNRLDNEDEEAVMPGSGENGADRIVIEHLAFDDRLLPGIIEGDVERQFDRHLTLQASQHARDAVRGGDIVAYFAFQSGGQAMRSARDERPQFFYDVRFRLALADRREI